MKRRATPAALALVLAVALSLFQQSGRTAQAPPKDDAPAAPPADPLAQNPAVPLAPATGLPGNWTGTIDVGGVELRLGLNVTQAEGGYAATFDSPDQGANGLPVESITLDGEKVHFAMITRRSPRRWRRGGNKDYAIVKLPGLNHLFQSSEAGSIAEYGSIQETFDPAAMELIADWAIDHTSPPAE